MVVAHHGAVEFVSVLRGDVRSDAELAEEVKHLCNDRHVQ